METAQGQESEHYPQENSSKGWHRPSAWCLVHVAGKNQPYLTRGPYQVQPDNHGEAVIPIWNTAPIEKDLPQNDSIGFLGNIEDCGTQEIDSKYSNAVAAHQQP